ncbi:hypothetical protein JTB14_030696 [Gonioctena quinquepunctata]|nr:hypothetical protein JTB14_030696 [Gonioctena quinquepunctata]
MEEDFGEKQREIENRIKILQLEHELKEAELATAADAENDDTNGSVSSKASKIDKHPLVADWIGNVNVVKPVTDNHFQIIPTVGQPRDVVDKVAPVHKVAPSGNNELLSRHIVDRDFSTFDGNPEEWPLFYQRYQQICRMCEYIPDEILIKLQKCLRGEAKSAVAEMLLTPKNVDRHWKH